MKRFSLAFMLGIILPALACSARPSAGHEEGVDDSANPVSPANPASPAKPVFNFTEQDYTDTMEFIHKNSPIRYLAMQQKGMKAPGRFMVLRFLELRRLQNDDHELYDLRVKEMQKEDEIFSMVLHLKGNANDASLKSDLDKAVAEVIAMRVQESEHRIAKLKEQLAAELAKMDELKRADAVGIRENMYLTQPNPLFGAGNGQRHPFMPPNPTAAPPTTAPVAAPTTLPAPAQ